MAIDPTTGTERIVQHIEAVLRRYRANRKPLENKWWRNYAHYRRDLTLLGRISQLNQESETESTPVVNSENDRFLAQLPPHFDVTTQKVTAANAIIGDVYFKGGRLPFMMSDDSLPTEINELLARLDEESDERTVLENRIAAVQENEDLLHRQNSDTGAARQYELAILSGSVYGKMFLKWFIQDVTRTEYQQVDEYTMLPMAVSENVPACAYKSPWALFYDYSVPIRESENVIEEDEISCLQLYEMRDLPGTVPGVIDMILSDRKSDDQKDQTASGNDDGAPPSKRELSYHDRTLKRQQFWGYVPDEAYQEYMRRETAEDGIQPSDHDSSPMSYKPPRYGFCTVVDGKLTRFLEADRSENPYYEADWQLLLDGIGAVSVADNVEAAQNVLDMAVKSLVEASDFLSKFVLAVNRRMINGDFNELKHALVLDVDEDVDDVRRAIQQLVFEDNTGPILKLIELFIQFAEQSSGVPKAEQGQQEQTAQTAFELKSRLERSGKYLGRVISRIDAMLEQLTDRSYRHNQLNPEVKIQKGNFRVRALGFTSFENKWDRVQRLINILLMILQHEELKAISKLRYLYEEIIKAEDIDPDQVIKTPAELMAEAAQIQEQMQRQEQAMNAAGGPTPDNAESLELMRAQIFRLQAEAQKKMVEADELQKAGVVKRAEAAARIQKLQSIPPVGAVA